jgi:hypothetical protein
MALLYARTLMLAKGIIRLYVGLEHAGEPALESGTRGDKEPQHVSRAAAMSGADHGLLAFEERLGRTRRTALPWRAYFHELCHSHQVGQALRHILRIAAVDFESKFADADLAGSCLFSRPSVTRHDDFAFASRQRFEARAQLLSLLFPFRA